MDSSTAPLKFVYDGWDGYQTSLVRAVAPLSPEQLTWRPAPHLRSVGQIAEHIGSGRVDWFRRIGAPGSAELAGQVPPEGTLQEDPSGLVQWLEVTWGMVEATLAGWQVSDLAKTYPHTYWGKTYAVSRQWTIWRIMAHDIHHGGQISVMLASQGIELPELGDLGGHLTVPPLA